MKIREFKESDADKIAKLSNANSEVFQYPRVTPEFLRDMGQNPDFKLFVLSEGSEVIGFCGVNYQAMPIVELGPICVEGGRRGHGLGKLIVDDVIEFSREIGAKKVIIKVKTTNTNAQDFFKSVGFEKVEGAMLGEIPIIIMQHGLE